MTIRPKQPALFPTDLRDIEIVDVEDRKTDELVIGFVGPIGSGITFCANIFAETLKGEFEYTGDSIKVSEVINRNSRLISEPAVSEDDEKRTEKLQSYGTKLRSKFGNTYLIEKVVKSDILNKIIAVLTSEGIVPKSKTALARAIIGKSDVRNLIEFSRAVHAEMEAIISVGRSGAAGLVQGTLYSTTFPCHNCARHIVAAGLNRVIYIEPYTKSLALKLHEDAISIHEKDLGSKVVFLQYEGVAPRNMIRLFNNRGSRKLDGKLLLSNRKQAKPASQAPLDGFEARERLIVARLSKLEKSSIEGGKDA